VFRRWLALVVMALVLVPFAWASSFPQRGDGPARVVTPCGSERWDVKTLTDPGRASVNVGNARASTVTSLAKMHPLTAIAARRSEERQVYRLKVIFDSLPSKKLGFKLESNDSDIHLAVRDSRGATMIAEFPASACTVGARYRSRMRQARADLIAACGPPPRGSFRELHGKATITGVLFFDFFHGQRGVSPNVSELHPVLGFTNATCR
jgi:hypothetical protein